MKSWRNLLTAGVLLFAIAQAIDLSTTLWAVHLGAHESNGWFLDPQTGALSPARMFGLKAVYTLLLPVLSGSLIWFGSRSKFLTSLPFWYEGLRLLWNADLTNVFGLIHYYAS